MNTIIQFLNFFTIGSKQETKYIPRTAPIITLKTFEGHYEQGLAASINMDMSLIIFQERINMLPVNNVGRAVLNTPPINIYYYFVLSLSIMPYIRPGTISKNLIFPEL